MSNNLLPYKKILNVYYSLLVIIGVYSTLIYLFFRSNFQNSYTHFLSNGANVITYVFGSIAFILFCLSVYFIFIIHKKKLKLVYSITPWYFIFYYLVWSSMVTFFVVLYYSNKYGFNVALEKINTLTSLDITFFLINILVGMYFLIKINTHSS